MRKKPFARIQQKLCSHLSRDECLLLPQKWEKIGSVLLFKLPSSLIVHKKIIAQVYAEVLQCSSVLLEKEGITGICRTPNVEHVFGKKNTETIHRENGVCFALDPAKVMFSSGNMDERKRMASVSNHHERVVDFFAGIGYFTIPMAVYSKPDCVVACEINPIAFDYLCKNIELNKVKNIVEPVLGDSMKIAPTDYADRVIMGYFHQTKEFLPTAVDCLKTGEGIIHFHDTFPDKQVPQKPVEIFEKNLGSVHRSFQILRFHKVKSFAPGIGHYVFDIRVKKP
ncbi:MAG: class I SAM-dependent methyltransferase family protein [Thermoplasmatota archaeon]